MFVCDFRCGEKVTRIEQCQLGTVFVCSYGSPRHGPGGCRRTYLSYRDMEAHIKHRHAKKDAPIPAPMPAQQPIRSMAQPPPNITNPPPQFMRPPNPNFPPPGHMVNHPPPSMAPTANVPPPGIPVVSHQHPVHCVPSNQVALQGSIPGMAGAARPGPTNSVVMQGAPGMMINSIHHRMPGHGMPHQQLPPGGRPPVHNNAIHNQRHIRPPPQNAPIRPHAPQPSSSNLISIPLQGGAHDQNNFNWQSGNQATQQQWQNNSRVPSNLPHQPYNS